MFGYSVIVFREVLEAALLVGIDLQREGSRVCFARVHYLAPVAESV